MTTECGKLLTRTQASAYSRAVKYGVLLGLFAACINVAGADDKANYERRAAANYMALFQSLDRNRDGNVTLSEAHGDLNLGPRFNDMDINRDGVVTTEELQRYIGREFGVQLNEVTKAGSR